MPPHEDLAVLLPVDILQHLALPAAGSALVHENDLVFIGGLQDRRGCMVRHPALVLADIQQHGKHALFRGGAGVEVVRENLVQRIAALVHHHLLPLKMGQPEGGRHIEDRPGGEPLADIVDAHKALHIGQGKGKKRRVHRADHQGVVPVVAPAGVERQQDDPLGLEPGHRLGPQL